MPEKLPYEIFLKTFEYVPRVALNILVTNESGEVLLTQRAIPPGEGMWHYPGSYLLKNEHITECLERIAMEELGLSIIGEEATLLGVFENLTGDPRGHVIDVIYGYTVKGDIPLITNEETKEMKFFKDLPEHIGFNQRDVLVKLGYR